MNRIIKLNILLMAVIVLAACEHEEGFIDSTIEDAKVLIVNESAPDKLTLIRYDDGSLESDDVYSSANGSQLEGPVAEIVKYRQKLYIIMPDAGRINVIDQYDFKLENTLDFSAEGRHPVQICFANATDAYVIFEGDSIVALVDLTTNTIARTIQLEGVTSNIACYANQLLVSCFNSNKAYVIDSRTHQVEASFNVAPFPRYITFSEDGAMALLLSLGNGKLNEEEEKTYPVLTFINLTNRQISSTLDITTYYPDAKFPAPQSMARANNNIICIPCREVLLRTDAIYGTYSSVMRQGNYYASFYWPKNKDLVIASEIDGVYELDAINAISFDTKHTVPLSEKIKTFVVL